MGKATDHALIGSGPCLDRLDVASEAAAVGIHRVQQGLMGSGRGQVEAAWHGQAMGAAELGRSSLLKHLISPGESITASRTVAAGQPPSRGILSLQQAPRGHLCFLTLQHLTMATDTWPVPLRTVCLPRTAGPRH